MFNAITAKKAMKNVSKYKMGEPKRDIKACNDRVREVFRTIKMYSKMGKQEIAERCRTGYETDLVSRKLREKGFSVKVEEVFEKQMSSILAYGANYNRLTISW